MVWGRALVILAVIVGIGGAGNAHADHAPAIVVPGKPGVPVIINGRDASGAIVFGDWGLSRPGTAPTVIYRQPWPRVRFGNPVPRARHHHRKRTKAPRCQCVKPAPRQAVIPPGQRHFYPGGPTPPVQGRLESDAPLSPPPKPAKSFSRSWATSSQPAPVTINQPPSVVGPIIMENRPRQPRPLRPPQPPRR